MTTKDLIEQVRELLPKLEHGVWRFNSALGCDGIPEPNMKLMGMSSQMAEALLEQHRQLQIAREAIKVAASQTHEAFPNCHKPTKMALKMQQALSEMESE